MNDKVPMLQDGYDRLAAELKNLKSVERPSVVQAIEEARAHGDLSENAEYHAAKERQGHIEGRIMELEGKLSRAQVIDPPASPATRSCLARLSRSWTRMTRKLSTRSWVPTKAT